MMLPLRRALRRHAPESLRRQIALTRRFLEDRRAGLAEAIVQPGAARADERFLPRITVRQRVFKTEHSEGKIENLRLASQRVSGNVIAPGSIFSFWALAGKPTAANGYRTGRSIVQDRLTAEVGGGLCQVSGLVYELALRAGLEIIERFPHSRDLYTEDTRFTPLGLDATVVWGFKDLRVRNTLAQPFALHVEMGDGEISGSLTTLQPIEEWRLEISREDVSRELRHVGVERVGPRGLREAISRSDYVVDVA